MILRRASEGDISTLMLLRLEAEAWLAAAGIDQWRNAATRGPALEKWREDITAGRTWVVVDASASVLATVTLAAPDMDFWRKDDAPDDAVYVAKLITARVASGSHLGGRILDWAGREGRARGLAWLRLDCWRANARLQNYYLGEGFRHVRTECPPRRLSGWLAERSTLVQKRPAMPLRVAAGAVTANQPSGGNVT